MNVEQAFLWACHSELEALKVGNVHIYGHGHQMTVQHFVASADCAAPFIGDTTLSVGERIRASIEATHAEVGSNTNLGIVLLAAPIAAATQSTMYQRQGCLRPALRDVLVNLSQQDAVDAYAAICMAYEPHLGTREQHDVRDAPTITLYQAMQHAQDNDIIARQYATAFEDVYAQGVALLNKNKHRPLGDTITELHVRFLSSLEDSHIARQHGTKVAARIQEQAHTYVLALEAEGLDEIKGRLLAWDRQLKAQNINPGACADLVVASLMLFFIENLQSRP